MIIATEAQVRLGKFAKVNRIKKHINHQRKPRPRHHTISIGEQNKITTNDFMEFFLSYTGLLLCLPKKVTINRLIFFIFSRSPKSMPKCFVDFVDEHLPKNNLALYEIID